MNVPLDACHDRSMTGNDRLARTAWPRLEGWPATSVASSHKCRLIAPLSERSARRADES
jgi:hypothetical protein